LKLRPKRWSDDLVQSWRTPALWRSATLRVVASYGLFFVLWTLVLAVLVYWETAQRVSAEAENLMKERADYFAATDPAALRERLQAMYDFDLLHINAYGLFDAQGHPLAGHIATLPPDLKFDGRSHVVREPAAGGGWTNDRIIAIHTRDGAVLLLARGTGVIDSIREFVLRAFFWGLSLTIVPGIVGGILLSLRPLRRIRELQVAADRIVAGRFGERLPVRGARDELDMLAGIVNRMLGEIERLMLEMKGVRDNVAHELRTPLTHLRTWLYRIQQQTAEDDPRAAAVERAIAEIDQLLARFSALLRISELRDEHRRQEFAATDLREVLEQVYGLYEPLAEEKSIRLELQAAGLSAVRGDRQLLIEAFSNLVANALKFTPAGGRVWIRASQERQGPRVDVEDTGPGIAPDQRNAIFGRFYRADRNHPAPGFGLGLSLVAAVARLHEFQVEAGAAPVGARLTVRCWSDRGPVPVE
jgi:signal transduction histidine kinase